MSGPRCVLLAAALLVAGCDDDARVAGADDGPADAGPGDPADAAVSEVGADPDVRFCQPVADGSMAPDVAGDGGTPDLGTAEAAPDRDGQVPEGAIRDAEVDDAGAPDAARPPCRPLVLGHRGIAWNRRGNPLPENTIVSIEAALAAGADGVEVDVVKTADDVMVLRHDDNLATRSPDEGGPRTDCRGRITASNWADISGCNAQPHSDGVRVPLDRLEALLELPIGLLVLDMKNDGIDVESARTLEVVLGMLREADATDRTVLMLYRGPTIVAAEAAGARACLKRQSRAEEDGGAIAEHVHALDAWGSCASGHLVDAPLMTSLREAEREQITFYLGDAPSDGYDRRLRTFAELDVYAVILDLVAHAVGVRDAWKAQQE